MIGIGKVVAIENGYIFDYALNDGRDGTGMNHAVYAKNLPDLAGEISKVETKIRAEMGIEPNFGNMKEVQVAGVPPYVER